MQYIARSLNERLSFLVAATISGICAAILPCLLFPSSPLYFGASSMLSYAGGHLALYIALWTLAFAAAWFFAGPRLIRPRQNLSTKLRLLAWSGVVGLLIDNVVSIYQFVNSVEASAGTVLATENLIGLAGRSLLYAVTFAAAIAICWLIGRTRSITETPPPRFGRE